MGQPNTLQSVTVKIFFAKNFFILIKVITPPQKNRLIFRPILGVPHKKPLTAILYKHRSIPQKTALQSKQRTHMNPRFKHCRHLFHYNFHIRLFFLSSLPKNISSMSARTDKQLQLFAHPPETTSKSSPGSPAICRSISPSPFIRPKITPALSNMNHQDQFIITGHTSKYSSVPSPLLPRSVYHHSPYRKMLQYFSSTLSTALTPPHHTGAGAFPPGRSHRRGASRRTVFSALMIR